MPKTMSLGKMPHSCMGHFFRGAFVLVAVVFFLFFSSLGFVFVWLFFFFCGGRGVALSLLAVFGGRLLILRASVMKRGIAPT